MLFIDSERFPAAVKLVDSDRIASMIQNEMVQDGQYMLVQKALEHLEKDDPGYSAAPWVRVLHMALDFYLEGVYRDCGCEDLVDYWIYKGSIEYCRDEYNESICCLWNGGIYHCCWFPFHEVFGLA